LRMNRLDKILFILVLFMISLPVNAEKYEVKLKECVDGDTAWFYKGEEEIKVRFIGIDAPEIAHEGLEADYYGDEASRYTCEELKNASIIELEEDPYSDKQDKYDRYLAWVFVDGILLEEKLVENGYAKVAYIYDDNYLYVKELCSLEYKAYYKNIGLWNKEEKIGYCSKYNNIEYDYKNILIIGIVVLFSLIMIILVIAKIKI